MATAPLDGNHGAGGAHAPRKPAAPPAEAPDLKKYDLNDDGKVTKDELHQAKAKERAQSEMKLVDDMFGKYDKNGDGKLDFGERLKMSKSDRKMLAKADRKFGDADGKVSKEEAQAAIHQRNEARESQAEWKYNRGEALQNHREFTQLDRADGRDGKVDANAQGGKFKHYDTDGDGKIDRREYIVGQRRDRMDDFLFGRRDTNGDGAISVDVKPQPVEGGGGTQPPAGGITEKEAQWEKEFNALDKTQDGWLSGNEVKGDLKKYDKDGDGEVTKAEFMAGKRAEYETQLREEAKAEFKKRNINEDGYLSGNETKGIEGYNTDKSNDKDGVRISEQEFIEGYVKDKLGGGGAPPTDGKPPVEGGGGQPPKVFGEKEAVQYLKDNFDKLAGPDGRISKEELKKLPDGPGKDALLKHFDTLIFGSIDPGKSAWSNLTKEDVNKLAEGTQKQGLDGYAKNLADKIIKERGVTDLTGDGKVDAEDLKKYVERNGGAPDPVQGGGPKPKTEFEKTDFNGDGKITADEIKARKELDLYDKNGDGKISKQEFLAKSEEGFWGFLKGQTRAQREMLFDQLDKDGNGSMDVRELQQKPVSFFENMANQAKANQMNDNNRARFDLNGDGMVEGREVAVRRFMDRLDGNGDKQISKEEFMRQMSPMFMGFSPVMGFLYQQRLSQDFDRLDKDKSGKLSPEELKSYVQANFGDYVTASRLS